MTEAIHLHPALGGPAEPPAAGTSATVQPPGA